MSWYKTGTVTVTSGSTTVMGDGTAFDANARVGDAFRGRDGNWYEVTNIASATTLSIFPAYQGPTFGGAAYSLAPMQGYVRESADRLRQIVEQWGTTLAGLGPVANQSVVPVSMGGTGGATAAAGRAGLGLGTAATANVIGTVAQSAGVPTGALMESGSNANGEYFKYAGGMLVCVKRDFSFTFASPVLPGANGISDFFPFPAQFIDTPAKSMNGYITEVTGSRTGIAMVNDSPAVGYGSTTWRFHIHNSTSVSVSRALNCDFIAIGRWY